MCVCNLTMQVYLIVRCDSYLLNLLSFPAAKFAVFFTGPLPGFPSFTSPPPSPAEHVFTAVVSDECWWLVADSLFGPETEDLAVVVPVPLAESFF